MKHKRAVQDNVEYYSSWETLSDALNYAIHDLAERERNEGTRWRRMKKNKDEGDGASLRDDKSRNKQWQEYCLLAYTVGKLERSGMSRVEALETLEVRKTELGSHRQLLIAMQREKDKHDYDEIVKLILHLT